MQGKQQMWRVIEGRQEGVLNTTARKIIRTQLPYPYFNLFGIAWWTHLVCVVSWPKNIFIISCISSCFRISFRIRTSPPFLRPSPPLRLSPPTRARKPPFHGPWALPSPLPSPPARARSSPCPSLPLRPSLRLRPCLPLRPRPSPWAFRPRYPRR